MNKYRELPVCILIPVLLGVLSSLVSSSGIKTWYQTIDKPWFTPPNWIFGPVWTLLYILMGIALWILWKSNHPKRTLALWLFAIQMLLNILWSPFFFALENPALAMIDIGGLLAVLLGLIYVSAHISKTASILLLPYLFWVAFASLLNWSIVILN